MNSRQPDRVVKNHAEAMGREVLTTLIDSDYALVVRIEGGYRIDGHDGASTFLMDPGYEIHG